MSANNSFLHKCHHILYICVSLAFYLLPGRAGAVLPGEVRWHDELNDTSKLTNILIEAAKARPGTDGELILQIARNFEGVPYVASTLEGSPEKLTVNLDELDCTTFVENVLALALTVKEGRAGWQDFVYNLGNMRYRQGRIDGYSSRLHYISDWIVDNTHRGNLKELTGRLPNSTYMVKTIDYMSTHRDSYPALADSAEYARLKSFEIGYRSHRFPYVRSSTLMSKWGSQNLTNGDILALTSKLKGLDVSHMGIVVMKPDGPHLLHASSKAGKVIEDSMPLPEYLKKNPNITGARVIRLADR